MGVDKESAQKGFPFSKTLSGCELQTPRTLDRTDSPAVASVTKGDTPSTTATNSPSTPGTPLNTCRVYREAWGTPLKRKRGIPAGSSNCPDSLDGSSPSCSKGGRILHTSRPPCYFDVLAKSSEDKPAPDTYNLSRSLSLPSPSRPVWRYKSATWSESKKLVKAHGESPGPGTYAPQDHRPMGKSSGPSWTFGRQVRPTASSSRIHTPAASPGNNFAKVPQKSTGHRCLMRNGVDGRKAALKLESESNVKQVLSPLSSDCSTAFLPGDTVASSSSVTASEFRPPHPDDLTCLQSPGAHLHPSVEKVAQCYKRLSGRRGTKSNTFLPMAAQRYEKICTSDRSSEYQRYHHSKKSQEKLSEMIRETMDSILVPVNSLVIEDMRINAVQALETQAAESLNSEGALKGKPHES
eukprot:TRINITY_DN21239_c0_g1_i2.p1 TRINITY_DN21239_c0_g1~~TRINITY_DN21239_c0_g1_i2.p1  ORF type:complete len:430 (-),score=27.75 TRINITY_DN21239_c0_g1_i2:137-1363(-)